MTCTLAKSPRLCNRPAQAAPAAGCYSAACRGLDPDQAGCSTDAYTVTQINTSRGNIQLRYSPSCRSNWARMTSPTPGTFLWIKECSSGYREEFSVPSGYTVAWTDMVDGAGPVKAGDVFTSTTCL
ncbi:DUF2690 domain-containing protein [Streptomyces sp. V4I8]|uniref:DUF2690 domain-containing protein n=1 Tax=Streptomyces sp. V4I8 TaxID=3156469 RepID=UPI003515F964